MVRDFNEMDVPFIIDGLKHFNSKISNELFENPFSKFLVCETNKKRVGFISYSEYYDRIEIDYIFVDLSYRRCGFASKMLEFLIKNSKSKKIDNITLEVSENNMAAINLYKKFGFLDGATRENYYGHGENAILMIRRF